MEAGRDRRGAAAGAARAASGAPGAAAGSAPGGALMARVVSVAQAAGMVPERALLTLGGFQLNRAPMALLFELARQRRRGLRVVTVPNPLGLDLLVGAGIVDEAEFGFFGFQYEDGFVVAPSVRRAVERGLLRFRERDVYEIVQGLRAAAQGIPLLPAPGGEASEYAVRNGTPRLLDAAGGTEEMLAAAAIRPDVALLHAQAADRDGNLLITDPYAEELLARASDRVIATAERLVERIERPTVAGGRVAALAAAPGGAWPTACHGRYRHGVEPIRAWVESAAAERFEAYLEGAVRAVPDHAAYVAAAGGPGDWPGEPAAAAETGATAAAAGQDGNAPTPADRILAGLARCIADGDVVTTGVASALPMLAIALARATHAPRLTYYNCVGAIDPVLDRALPTSVDARLLDRCAGRIGLPDLFDLARRGGIDLMFFGAAQIDAAARMNLTCIGDYAHPRVKLPGPAGSSSMRPYVRKVVIVAPRHTPRTLVPRVDFVTSAPSPRNRDTRVVTDLAVLRLQEGGLRLLSRHAPTGAALLREKTGFDLQGDFDCVTPEPSGEEMKVLRTLDPGGIRHRLI
jgi:glutaconate CoA-transferase, subunit B